MNYQATPIPPKSRTVISHLMFAIVLATLTGCAELKDITITGHLWDNDMILNHYQPATNANLRLFFDAHRVDYLAQYDEENENDEIVHRRAFFLLANRTRVGNGKQPHFEDLKLADKLEFIPLESAYSQLNSQPPSGLRARLAADGRSFTLYRDGAEIGFYRLPTYVSTASKAERVFLTPGAVVVDVVIVAAIAGAVVGVLYLESHSY